MMQYSLRLFEATGFTNCPAVECLLDIVFIQLARNLPAKKNQSRLATTSVHDRARQCNSRLRQLDLNAH